MFPVAMVGWVKRPLLSGCTMVMAALDGLARASASGPLPHGDDRLLRDIGLTRHDVPGFRVEPLFREPAIRFAPLTRHRWPSRSNRAALAALVRLRDADGGPP